MIINTEQLHLRLANENDIPNMQKYFAVWEVMKHMNDHGSWPYPEDGAEKFYHDTIKPNQNKNR